MEIRKAVFSGSWYPSEPGECEREIQNFLKETKVKDMQDRTYVGGIVPHAGWYFSGSIACNVINLLRGKTPPDVFILFGMHLHPASPYFIMTHGAWDTPFGAIEIDDDFASQLAGDFSFEIETATRFTPDNTIELQLPFIKYFFKDTKIVPMGVPPVKQSLEIGKAVADISKRMGKKVKVIGSTDLTHYGLNYGFVSHGRGADALDWVRSENDKRVIDAMLAMDPVRVIDEGLKNQNACCSGAAATAIMTGRKLGAAKAEKITYATSYDKSPGDSFVGYVGIVF